ncbi:MAG TPA: DsrE family protein [Candidatus Manganitrophaceae bacterium]|nr:DsrE family protein [Candidatus Manganitrophaceae bacterium]
MARYLIVDSRDLTEYTSGRYIQKVAGKLKESGNDVTLFLIENGVIAARKGGEIGKNLSDLSKRGAKVVADDISCRARGITQLAEGITQGSVDQLADLIVEGSDKVIWY